MHPKKMEQKQDSMRGLVLVLALILIVAIAVGVYKADGFVEKDVLVATIDGEDIYMSEVNERWDELPEGYKEQITKDSLIQSLIDEKIILKEGVSAGLKVTSEEVQEAYVKLLEERDLPREAFLTVLEEEGRTEIEMLRRLQLSLLAIKLVDPYVKQLYEQHKEEFVIGETVRASHFLVKTLEEAEAGITRIKAGEDFNDVASEISTDPSAQVNKGDLGFFERGVMVAEFEEAAFTLSIGEMSEPVKTQFGYHVILVQEKKPLRNITLDEAKADLLVLAMPGFLKEQRKFYDVQIHYEGMKQKELKFEN